MKLETYEAMRQKLHEVQEIYDLADGYDAIVADAIVNLDSILAGRIKLELWDKYEEEHPL